MPYKNGQEVDSLHAEGDDFIVEVLYSEYKKSLDFDALQAWHLHCCDDWKQEDEMNRKRIAELEGELAVHRDMTKDDYAEEDKLRALLREISDAYGVSTGAVARDHDNLKKRIDAALGTNEKSPQ